MLFLKIRFYIVAFFVFMIGIFLYQYFFVRKFSKLYKQDGRYAIGKISEVRMYGRGTGYNYIYTFNISNKTYKGVCDIGALSYNNARKKIDSSFLVIYLKDDIYNNRIYSNIPINNNAELEKWINSDLKIKSKTDSIPSPGYFFQNYF